MLENPRTKLEKKTLLFYYLEISFKRFIHVSINFSNDSFAKSNMW